MRPGTPGFEPSRLKAAREAKGLTPLMLAEVVGVKRQAVYQYERGEISPHPDVLMRLALVLGVRPGFFQLPPIPSARTLFFRSSAGVTARARARGERRAERAWLVWDELGKRLELPTPNVPEYSEANPIALDDDEIEEAATRARRHWGMGDGPIANTVWLLENNGIVVVREDIADRTMDSWSRWEAWDANPVVILNSFKASAVRSRFDAAHELGHLVLHRAVRPDYWASQEDGVAIREEQAHKFLLPSSPFVSETKHPSLERFLAMKPRWKASVQAMVRRARDLHVIDEARYTQMQKGISKLRWRSREPLDDELPMEEPRLVRRAFEVLKGHDPDAPTALSLSLELQTEDLASLAGLPEAFFESPRLIEFRQRG